MADAGEIPTTGAIGNVGSALLGFLGDADIRTLTYDESKARSLEEGGVEAVFGLSNPGTLGPAYRRCERGRGPPGSDTVRERVYSLDL